VCHISRIFDLRVFVCFLTSYIGRWLDVCNVRVYSVVHFITVGCSFQLREVLIEFMLSRFRIVCSIYTYICVQQYIHVFVK
jgi:hypothetical protein